MVFQKFFAEVGHTWRVSVDFKQLENKNEKSKFHSERSQRLSLGSTLIPVEHKFKQ